jgi:arachidonate 5-lipoxygenase
MVRDKFLDALMAIYHRLQLALVTLLVTLLVSANSLFGRVRMSHENGIACSGRLRIVDDPKFPPHDFFQPGQAFACRVRHAAASFKDDAKLVVRSASIKFQDDRFDSPLDLLMNTGTVPLFWNARTFVGFMISSMGGKGKSYVSYLRRHPQAAVGGGVSVRRNPESFGRMKYHTKTVTGFIGRDGVCRYARYRLVPDPEIEQESGEPDQWDRHHAWLQNPYRDETRTRNYLKDATREQLAAGNALCYRLQIQLRDKPPSEEGPQPQWLSSAVPWDEKRFPYLDLATVELNTALSYEESMLTWFHMGNHPASLPIPKARSIDDPHSLNHLRLASIWARRARLLSYRLRGMPKAFPNTRKADDWVGIPPLRDPPG